MKSLKVKKDVVIYHPSYLIVEKGSVLRCNGIIFGVIGSKAIMNEHTHPKEYTEHFEEIE